MDGTLAVLKLLDVPSIQKRYPDFYAAKAAFINVIDYTICCDDAQALRQAMRIHRKRGHPRRASVANLVTHY